MGQHGLSLAAGHGRGDGRAAGQEAEISVATQRQEERAAQSAAAQIFRQMEDATREMTRLNAQEQVDHEQHGRLREAMTVSETARREAGARMDELKAQLDELVAKEAVQTNALTESRIELATQTQQCEAWQQHQRCRATSPG